MLDIYGRAPAEHSAPVVRNTEFFRIELAPLADGTFFVSLTATTVDDEEPQLLDQEIASGHVATIDAALALISEHARFVFHSSTRKDT